MFLRRPATRHARVPCCRCSGDVPAGTYREMEFEVEDLEDDEENPAERARIDNSFGSSGDED